jgi:small-conductance mechanosensitive channel
MPGFFNTDVPLLGTYGRELIFSMLLVVTVLLLRTMAARALLRYEKVSSEVRRRWVAAARNLSIAIVVFGLLSIWAEELRTLAVSLIAFAVAAVIATKELILCASGALVRAAGDAYGIGDRIEIAGARGEVVDQSMLTTTLLEIGPPPAHQFTGRTIVIPNSLLLSSPVVNETFDEQVDLHVIRVPIDEREDWQEAERLLLDAARLECGDFMDEARRHLRRVQAVRGVEAPSVEPRVTLHLPDPGKVVLLLRVATPARRKGRVEQAILRRYLRSRGAVPAPPVRMHQPA